MNNCKIYNAEVLPDENNNCSLCESSLNKFGECQGDISNKGQNSRLEFAKFVNSTNNPDEIFLKAFELIKEGLVNKAINCTLDGDMNLLNLDEILNEPDWDKSDNIIVSGSHGIIEVDPVTYQVITTPNDNNEYSSIIKFDIDEYREYWAGTVKASSNEIDILDLGYWYGESNKFESPEIHWREEIKLKLENG